MEWQLQGPKQSKRNHSIFLKEAEALRGWQKQWPGNLYNSSRVKRQLVDSIMWQRPEQLDGAKWKEMRWRQRNRGTRTPRPTRVEAKGTGTWLLLSCWYLSLLGLHQKVEDMELIKIERLLEFTLILECDTVWAINVMRWIGDKKYFLGRSWACVNIGTDSPCWNKNTFPPAMHSYFDNFTQSNPWAAWTICSYCALHSSFCAGFRLGSTVRSETKGIWMWCVPHPSKENHILVLLDTEGLGNVEKVRQGIFSTLFPLSFLCFKLENIITHL